MDSIFGILSSMGVSGTLEQIMTLVFGGPALLVIGGASAIVIAKTLSVVGSAMERREF